MAQVFIIKNGMLHAKQPTSNQVPKPAVVTYQHTIRRISESKCECHWEISKLKLDHEKECKSKSHEISVLLKRIIQKDQQIQNIQSQIMTLRKNKFQRDPSMIQNVLQDITNNQFSDDKIKQNGLNQTTVSLLNQSTSFSYQKFGIQKTQLEMKDCFKKTDSLMSQIESMLKNTKKYEFYNKFQKKEDIILQEPELQSQKSLDQTDQILMQDTIYLPNCDYEFDQDSFTDVSNCEFKVNQHNFSNDQQFFQKTIQETISLKNSLEDFKKQSAIQLETVQSFYKNQLKKVKSELDQLKNKSQMVGLTRQKIQKLSERGKLMLKQLQESFEYEVQYDQKSSEQLLIEES